MRGGMTLGLYKGNSSWFGCTCMRQAMGRFGGCHQLPCGCCPGHLGGVWWQNEGQRGGQVWSRAWRDVREGRQRVTDGSNASCLVRGGVWTLLPPKNLVLYPKTTFWTSLSLEKPSCPLTAIIDPQTPPARATKSLARLQREHVKS